MKRKIIILSSLFFMSILNAQGDKKVEKKVISLEDVVIVATRRPTKISDIPGTVWVIPQEKVQTLVSTGVPLKEMLGQLIPGMDVGPQGRTNFGQNMRGRPMLVMIDGVSLNGLRGVSRQLDAINPFNIERIEVLSGASAIYGGNSTGGVINIITKKPKKNEVSGETELSYRSGFVGKEDGDYTISQSLSVKDDKVYGRLGFSLKQNGGFYGSDEKQIFTDIVQTDLQYNRSMDILATGGYEFNDNHKIALTAQYYESKYNGDRALSFGPNFNSIFKGDLSLLKMKDGFSSDNEIKTQRHMSTISYNGRNILGGQDIYLQLSYRSEELGFYPFPSALMSEFVKTPLPLISSSEQNTSHKEIKLLLSKNLNKLNFSYGFDADFEDFDAFRHVYDYKVSFASEGLLNKEVNVMNRYPSNQYSSYAGFIQVKYKLTPKLTVKGAARYQHMNVNLDDFKFNKPLVEVSYGIGTSVDAISGGTDSANTLLTNAGLLFKVNNEQQLWGTFSQGAQLPDPSKYYGIGVYKLNFKTGNWDLKYGENFKDKPLEAITTNQYELGYRTNVNGFKAQLSGFYSISDRYVSIKKDTDKNLYLDISDKNHRNMGVEAEVSYTMDNGLYVGANALLIKSEFKEEGKWLKQDIYTLSPSKLGSYLGYKAKDFNVRVQSQNTFDIIDSKGREVKGYNLVDASVGYKTIFGKFTLGVQNVLNTDYQTVWSARAQALYGSGIIPKEIFNYKGRGRTFNISYNYAF